MISFLKACGKGILYVIIFPFAIALVCGYAVVGLLIFLFLIGKSVILFFKGKTIFSDLPEDVEAKRILIDRENTLTNPSSNDVKELEPSNDNGPLSLYPSDANMYKSEFTNLGRNEEHQVSDSNNQPMVQPVSNNNIEQEKDDGVIIETYKPLSSNNKDD